MPASKIGRSIASALFAAAMGQASGILRTEFANAKVELQTKAKKLGVGGALVALAASLLCFSFVFGLIAAMFALATVWSPWVAALVLSASLLFIASILLGIGATLIRRNKDLKPQQSIDNISKLFKR